MAHNPRAPVSAAGSRSYGHGCGGDEADIDRWTKLPKTWVPGVLQWSAHLKRYIDTRFESDVCVFCGTEIDPETSYHNSICRRCA